VSVEPHPDRRDAAILAILRRAGEFTEVSVSDAAHEASENGSREAIYLRLC
jgi:hypothetical protein